MRTLEETVMHSFWTLIEPSVPATQKVVKNSRPQPPLLAASEAQSELVVNGRAARRAARSSAHAVFTPLHLGKHLASLRHCSRPMQLRSFQELVKFRPPPLELLLARSALFLLAQDDPVRRLQW